MIINKLGPGPIISASGWNVTQRMDKAGDFAFTMPTSDELAAYVRAKRNISIYAQIGNIITPTSGGTITYMGGGIIDSIAKRPNSDGGVSMTVSGSDALRLLTYRTISFQFANVLAVDVMAYLNSLAPDWTFYSDPSWTALTPTLYLSFSGETILSAAIKVAEKLGAHIYLVGRRALQFQTIPDVSGVRAIQARDDFRFETCAIVDLEEVSDSYEIATRIIPFGAGQGAARLTLAASNATPPAGYTLNLTENYLKNDAAERAYGIIERRVEFKTIVPISNTDADMQAAANSLYDSAKVWLDLNTTPHYAYRLKIAHCHQALHPMQTIRVVYRNDNLDINDDLLILESTVQGDANGVYTTDLVVSNLARWPSDDSGSVVDTIKQSQAFVAHPQLNANAYTTGYTKTVDDTYNATFRFRFGSEVAQINQVLFEFQILPLESTVKSVGGTATGSVDIPSHTHTVSISSHTHSVSISGHTHDIPLLGDAASQGFARLVYFNPPDSGLYYDATAGPAVSVTSDSGGSSSPTSSSGGSSTPTTASGGEATGITVDISNAITAVYGIFRESGGNTFAIADLEYSVNNGTWFSLDTAIVVDIGWYQLDITPLVQNSTTFRPLAISNHLDIRKASAAAAKTATIDALLSVRNVVQAITYS